MAEVKIQQQGMRTEISVDGMPLKQVTRLSVEMAHDSFPLVTLELTAFQNAIELSDARLKIGGIEAPEALERAMLEHLQAKYAPAVTVNVGYTGGIVGEVGAELVRDHVSAAIRTMSADLARLSARGKQPSTPTLVMRLPVREMSPEPKLFEDAGSTAPAGLCRVATDGERLGRV